ncbi:MAG TPA: hypothetical protein VK127_02445 [Nitrososphaerales archaeon]|nr:hypothetical protein [Nitrososphaerales archaeon]
MLQKTQKWYPSGGVRGPSLSLRKGLNSINSAPPTIKGKLQAKTTGSSST